MTVAQQLRGDRYALWTDERGTMLSIVCKMNWEIGIDLVDLFVYRFINSSRQS